MNGTKKTRRRRCHTGILAADITKEQLAQWFHLPSHEACAQLGISLSVLKRVCRKQGIPRWPYRAMNNSWHPPPHAPDLSAGRLPRDPPALAPSAGQTTATSTTTGEDDAGEGGGASSGTRALASLPPAANSTVALSSLHGIKREPLQHAQHAQHAQQQVARPQPRRPSLSPEGGSPSRLDTLVAKVVKPSAAQAGLPSAAADWPAAGGLPQHWEEAQWGQQRDGLQLSGPAHASPGVGAVAGPQGGDGGQGQPSPVELLHLYLQQHGARQAQQAQQQRQAMQRDCLGSLSETALQQLQLLIAQQQALRCSPLASDPAAQSAFHPWLHPHPPPHHQQQQQSPPRAGGDAPAGPPHYGEPLSRELSFSPSIPSAVARSWEAQAPLPSWHGAGGAAPASAPALAQQAAGLSGLSASAILAALGFPAGGGGGGDGVVPGQHGASAGTAAPQLSWPLAGDAGWDGAAAEAHRVPAPSVSAQAIALLHLLEQGVSRMQQQQQQQQQQGGAGGSPATGHLADLLRMAVQLGQQQQQSGGAGGSPLLAAPAPAPAPAPPALAPAPAPAAAVDEGALLRILLERLASLDKGGSR